MKRVLMLLLPSALVLAVGIGGYGALRALKKEPAKATGKEHRLAVAVREVHPERSEVVLTALGTVRPLNVVAMAPEVSGVVTEVHPHLEVGQVIPAGETVFAIDPRTYEARVADAKATSAQLTSTVARLGIQYRTDRERCKTIERTRDLAQRDYGRLEALLEQDEVGTQAGVERAEQAYNTAQDALDRMNQALSLYPIQIEEAKSAGAAAAARLVQAQVALERTRIVAPFDARVKAHGLEAGQYVAPGVPVVTLADDAVLEVSLPLDSRDARQWLLFDGSGTDNGGAWFASLRPVECEIRWTEDDDHHWVGRLHRVEQFDERTRTLHVAIRIGADQARSQDANQLPLVDGMFCRVAIPGRALGSVFRVPRSAVTFEGTVYVARRNGEGEHRLHTVPVTVVRDQGEEALIGEGLEAGDLVIVTRLVDPLEYSLLDIRRADEGEASS